MTVLRFQDSNNRTYSSVGFLSNRLKSFISKRDNKTGDWETRRVGEANNLVLLNGIDPYQIRIMNW